MRFPKFFSACLIASFLFGAGSIEPALAGADSDVSEMVEKLGASDFRVRVQSALLLGKSADPEALPALVRALDDSSAAVRAAAAAALGTYGDPAALKALEAHQKDENEAVRRQIRNAMSSLGDRQRIEVQERKSARVFVKLGGMKSRVRDGRSETIGVLSVASRGALGRLPGVAVLHPSEDPEVVARGSKRPVVLISGSIRELEGSKVDGEFVVSANVEFLVQPAPEFAIVGKLSGRAKASGDSDSTKDAQGRARVQEAALAAAIESALSKSTEALVAAGKRG